MKKKKRGRLPRRVEIRYGFRAYGGGHSGPEAPRNIFFPLGMFRSRPLARFVPSFFFSSRRRHTRWPRDWSSDVCSSDLVLGWLPSFGRGETVALGWWT